MSVNSCDSTVGKRQCLVPLLPRCSALFPTQLPDFNPPPLPSIPRPCWRIASRCQFKDSSVGERHRFVRRRYTGKMASWPHTEPISSCPPPSHIHPASRSESRGLPCADRASLSLGKRCCVAKLGPRHRGRKPSIIRSLVATSQALVLGVVGCPQSCMVSNALEWRPRPLVLNDP